MSSASNFRALRQSGVLNIWWICLTPSGVRQIHQSQFAAMGTTLWGTKLAPLSPGGGAVEFEICSAVEMSFLVEMVVV
jgi:hypothetical protein